MSSCRCVCGLGEKGERSTTLLLITIRINGASRVMACRLAWVHVCTVLPLNGMVGSHGYSGVSVAHDMCMRMRLRANLCGIVGTYLCCHGLRCGSSSRRRGHDRPDSPPFSVSPSRGLPTRHEKLEGIVRTFGNLPEWTEHSSMLQLFTPVAAEAFNELECEGKEVPSLA